MPKAGTLLICFLLEEHICSSVYLYFAFLIGEVRQRIKRRRGCLEAEIYNCLDFQCIEKAQQERVGGSLSPALCDGMSPELAQGPIFCRSPTRQLFFGFLLHLLGQKVRDHRDLVWGLHLLHSFFSPLPFAWRYTDGQWKRGVGKNRPSTANIPLSPWRQNHYWRKNFPFPPGLREVDWIFLCLLPGLTQCKRQIEM